MDITKLQQLNIDWKDIACILLHLKPEAGKKNFSYWSKTVDAFRKVLRQEHPKLVDDFNQIVECYYSPEQRKALEEVR